MFFDLFTSEQGQEVLEHLEDKYIKASTWPPQASDGMTLALCQARREGQNDLVRYIKLKVKTGSKKA